MWRIKSRRVRRRRGRIDGERKEEEGGGKGGRTSGQGEKERI